MTSDDLATCPAGVVCDSLAADCDKFTIRRNFEDSPLLGDMPKGVRASACITT